MKQLGAQVVLVDAVGVVGVWLLVPLLLLLGAAAAAAAAVGEGVMSEPLREQSRRKSKRERNALHTVDTLMFKRHTLIITVTT